MVFKGKEYSIALPSRAFKRLLLLGFLLMRVILDRATFWARHTARVGVTTADGVAS
jgi:hypothetical protein